MSRKTKPQNFTAQPRGFCKRFAFFGPPPSAPGMFEKGGVGMMGYEAIRLARTLAVEEIVSVHYFEYSSSYYFEGERHDFWEFLYVDKGELDVRAGEEDRRLSQGQIIFHRPGEFHALSANGVVAPNLVVVSFFCGSEAMRFFEGRIL